MQASLEDRAIFFRSLGTMFQSGVPLLPALENVAAQVAKPQIKAATLQVTRCLEGGNPLSRALSMHPWLFSPWECRLVQTGEGSGRLSDVLLRLASELEGRLRLRRKVVGSLVTPLCVCSACLVLVVVLPPLLFRGLYQMLADSGTPLPLPTQILMGFSQLLTSPLAWLASSLLAACLGLSLMRLSRGRQWRGAAERALLRLPWLGATYRDLASVQFLRTLQGLLEVGVPLIKSLEMSASVANSSLLMMQIRRATQALEEGETLHESLGRAPFFPPGLVHSLKAGEESGKLTHLLASLGELYSVELDHRINTLSQALEPLMMGALGMIVGFTCLASILPIVKVLESL
ncbi:type II secretion system F family protein [bacterium]|nr:type II secretion system F family protein [bacterium]